MPQDRPLSTHDAETMPVAERPASTSLEHLSRLVQVERHPERIGEYRIIRLLGSGGMGHVYLAQRAQPSFTQTVALKVIKKGMDSEEILGRFELERRLLSGLNHANIARLIDGGTTDDGRPYFVLEYVEGVPINTYCDRHRLSIRRRLDLFRKVCAAVHHAHQNLIVHRDLKPGNVLVTAEGEPKLLDFGIAKLLNPTLFQAAAVTGPAVRLMTPEYASPEQVKGDTITTASDIYSLGVLLYELLTGRRPYNFKTRLQHEIVRIVCEEPPERPSTVISRAYDEPTDEGTTRRVDPATVALARDGDITRLRKRLKGDIDDIVLKALDKTPTRRYASAEQFAEDIRRHLAGEPVIARPPSLSYRASKFVRRHRVPVAAAAGTALALILGVVGTSVQWARAEDARHAALAAQADEMRHRAEAEQARDEKEQERLAAEQARKTAEQSYRDTWDVLSSYIGEVHAAVAALPGAVQARDIIVHKAADKMQALADRWQGDRDKTLTVSAGFERLGQLAADIRGGHAGESSKALDYQQRALVMRQRLLDAEPDSIPLKTALAASRIRIGDLNVLLSRHDLARESYSAALAILETLDGDKREQQLARTMLAAVLGQLGDLERNRGDLAAARPLYDRADALRRALRDLAVADAAAPDLDPRESQRRIALAARARRNVTVGQLDLARLLVESGKADEAHPLFSEAISERRRLLTEEPGQSRTRRDLAVALVYSSDANSRAGNHAQAVRDAQESLALMAQLTAEEADKPDARNLTSLGMARTALAHALLASAPTDPDRPGALEAALRSYHAAVELLSGGLAADADNADLRQLLADAQGGVAESCLALSRPAHAVEPAASAVRLGRMLVEQSPADVFLTRRLAQDLRRQGDAHAALAEDETLPLNDRRRARESAADSYRDALPFAEQFEAVGLLPPDEKTRSDAILARLEQLSAP